MIVTVTPNPSVDRTISVTKLVPGAVHRASATRTDPGGKGVNVARALVRNGAEAMAVLPLGGDDGEWVSRALTRERVAHRVVPVDGATRTNVAIVDEGGRTTKVNEPGPSLPPGVLEAFVAAIDDEASHVALCGSLPAGADPELFAELVRRYRGRCVVDTSGIPFARAVAAGPSLIKPNVQELAELVGTPLPRLGDVVDAARTLVDAGVGVVVASLGADGALWVSDDTLAFAAARAVRPRSTVGAGDCLLAGVLAALDEGATPELALAQGVAWGAASVSLPGSAVPGPDDIAPIVVHSTTTPDLSTPLTD